MRNKDSSVGSEGESKEWTESEQSPSRHERSFMTDWTFRDRSLKVESSGSNKGQCSARRDVMIGKG
jgi:hypothetical protein